MMIRVLKENVSPILAFVLIIAFGIFCIVLMDNAFKDFAENELLISDFHKEVSTLSGSG